MPPPRVIGEGCWEMEWDHRKKECRSEVKEYIHFHKTCARKDMEEKTKYTRAPRCKPKLNQRKGEKYVHRNMDWMVIVLRTVAPITRVSIGRKYVASALFFLLRIKVEVNQC